MYHKLSKVGPLQLPNYVNVTAGHFFENTVPLYCQKYDTLKMRS